MNMFSRKKTVLLGMGILFLIVSGGVFAFSYTQTQPVQAAITPGLGVDPSEISWQNPTDGSTVSGTSVNITIKVLPADEIFTVLWCKTKSATCSPSANAPNTGTIFEGQGIYTSLWNTVNDTNGLYNLCAKAMNPSGGAVSQCIRVDVNNQTTLSWESPANNETVSGTVNLRVRTSPVKSGTVIKWCATKQSTCVASNALSDNTRGIHVGTWDSASESGGDGKYTLCSTIANVSPEITDCISVDVLNNPTGPNADLDGNGVVDVRDLGIMLGWFDGNPIDGGPYPNIFAPGAQADGTYAKPVVP